jgi:hypothetical protein
MTTTSVTREHVWTAFRRTPEAWRRERDHAIWLRMDGQSCPAVAQGLSRDVETMHA